MENSAHEFSFIVFLIQMAVLFSVVYGVYVFLKYKKKKVDESIEQESNQSKEKVNSFL